MFLQILPNGQLMAVNDTIYQQKSARPLRIVARASLWRDLLKILMIKLWHTLSFSLERTDFKNVIFEKIPWAPSDVAEVKRPRNSK